jgi:hypothetical protein
MPAQCFVRSASGPAQPAFHDNFSNIPPKSSEFNNVKSRQTAVATTARQMPDNSNFNGAA